MHENRETSGASRSDRGRSGKAHNHKPDRYAAEESHDAIVPMKPPNNAVQAAAEVVEGRASLKENTCLLRTRPTQCGIRRVPEADGCAVGRLALAATIQEKSRMR